MQKIKSEKGITLLILVITVIVLALISVPIIINTTDIKELQEYTYFKGDIDKLREAIEVTYTDMEDLSTIGPKYTGNISFLGASQNGSLVVNPNDGLNYYVINLKNLNRYRDVQIDLKYGQGNKEETYENNEYAGDDVYIINEDTKTIYYVKGVQYKGETYYRLPEDFTKQTELYVISYDANGGTNAPDMQSVNVKGQSITIGDAPEREGYTFIGYLDENTDSMYQPGEIYTVTDNVQFVAQWQ